MDLKELTQLMNEFVADKGWYQKKSLRPQTPKNLAISLSLEAAEVLEHFQWSDQCKAPDELAAELADVQLYLMQLAAVSGIDLEKSVLDKLRVNQARSWDQDDKVEGER